MAHAGSHDVHRIGFNVHFTILVILLILTAITVYAAGIDFGNPNYNIIVAMLIASVKVGLVGLYFMHLRYENPLIWLFVIIPFVLLFVMIGGVFIDNPTRTVPGRDSYLEDRPAAAAHHAEPAAH